MGLLQIVGSGNRNHLVPPGIHPLGQPTDVPSLAGRIPTFIDQNHGNAETVDLMMELLNLPLPRPPTAPGRSPCSVGWSNPPYSNEEHWKRQAVWITRVEGRSASMSPPDTSRPRFMNSFPQGRNQIGKNLEGRLVGILGGNLQPGRIRQVGLLKHTFHRRLILLVFPVSLQNRVGDPPGRDRVALQSGQAGRLFLLGNLQEKLENDVIVPPSLICLFRKPARTSE